MSPVNVKQSPNSFSSETEIGASANRLYDYLRFCDCKRKEDKIIHCALIDDKYSNIISSSTLASLREPPLILLWSRSPSFEYLSLSFLYRFSFRNIIIMASVLFRFCELKIFPWKRANRCKQSGCGVEGMNLSDR